MIHMTLRSNGYSYAEVTSEARCRSGVEKRRDSVPLSTGPFESLWAGVEARIRPDMDS